MPKAPGNPSPSPTLRRLLKRHTAAAHAALQASPLVGRLLAADLTWSEYCEPPWTLSRNSIAGMNDL